MLDLDSFAAQLNDTATEGDLDAPGPRLAHRSFASKGSSAALQLAARHGEAASLAKLIPLSDPLAEDSRALRLAAENGHLDCVRLLIPVSDPLASQSYALQMATRNGHEECVRELIPVSDPLVYDSMALSWAAGNGHPECVRLLIPVSDPLSKHSLALRWAALRGHADCVTLLLPVSDPLACAPGQSSASDSARQGGHEHVAQMIDAFIEANALCESCPRAPRRKMTSPAL